MGDAIGVRHLQRDEIAKAASMLAASFDDDPLFRFLLPDASRRATLLRWFHESALTECIAVGGAFTTNDGPETGAIGLVPPGHWPIPLYRTLRSIAVPRALPTFHLARHGLHIEGRIRSLHPPSPHVYVYVLGVHPSLKGRGLGAALMRHACAMAKAKPCVVHLETSNPVNLPFYRRFNLEVGTEIVSHGGPPVWTMTTPT